MTAPLVLDELVIILFVLEELVIMLLVLEELVIAPLDELGTEPLVFVELYGFLIRS